MDHVTLTVSLLGLVCHRRQGSDTVYLYAKLDNSSFSHSTDVIWGIKIKG